MASEQVPVASKGVAVASELVPVASRLVLIGYELTPRAGFFPVFTSEISVASVSGCCRFSVCWKIYARPPQTNAFFRFDFCPARQ